VNKCKCGNSLREDERECNKCVMRKYHLDPTAPVWGTLVGEVLANYVAKALRMAESHNEPHEFRYDEDGNLVDDNGNILLQRGDILRGRLNKKK